MYLLSLIILTILILFVILKNEAPLPEKFKDYKYLSEELIESDNYEIIKIIENWKGEAENDGILLLDDIFYDTITKNTLFFTSPNVLYTNLKGQRHTQSGSAQIDQSQRTGSMS